MWKDPPLDIPREASSEHWWKDLYFSPVLSLMEHWLLFHFPCLHQNFLLMCHWWKQPLDIWNPEIKTTFNSIKIPQKTIQKWNSFCACLPNLKLSIDFHFPFHRTASLHLENFFCWWWVLRMQSFWILWYPLGLCSCGLSYSFGLYLWKYGKRAVELYIFDISTYFLLQMVLTMANSSSEKKIKKVQTRNQMSMNLT